MLFVWCLFMGLTLFNYGWKLTLNACRVNHFDFVLLTAKKNFFLIIFDELVIWCVDHLNGNL